MRETELQKKSIKLLKDKGWLCIRISNPTSRGLPDVLAISPNGVVVAIEFKVKQNKQSPLQEWMQQELERRNIRYFVVRSIYEVHLIVNGQY